MIQRRATKSRATKAESFSETISEKRGRPSAVPTEFFAENSKNFPILNIKTQRGMLNKFYELECQCILSADGDFDSYIERYPHIWNDGKPRSAILRELYLLHRDEGFSIDQTLESADVIDRKLASGVSAKRLAEYTRDFRLGRISETVSEIDPEDVATAAEALEAIGEAISRLEAMRYPLSAVAARAITSRIKKLTRK